MTEDFHIGSPTTNWVTDPNTMKTIRVWIRGECKGTITTEDSKAHAHYLFIADLDGKRIMYGLSDGTIWVDPDATKEDIVHAFASFARYMESTLQ